MRQERKIPVRHAPIMEDKIVFEQIRNITNKITTTKYTKFTIVTKGLAEQFQKQANVYFLMVIVLMFIGTHTNLWIGTISAWSTASILAGMVSISIAVSWVDDKAREKSDKYINEKSIKVIDGPFPRTQGSTRHNCRSIQQWQDIKVGDILEIKDGDEIPADVIILNSQGRLKNGLCYVSTANLDGETNLKVKHSVFGSEDTDSDVTKTTNAWVEAPLNKIYSFNGRLEIRDSAKGIQMHALSMDNILLRGCSLKNSTSVHGLVIYTGQETRIMMNSKKSTSKLSHIEHIINKTMWVAVATQGILAMIADIIYNVFEKENFRKLWYIYPKGYSSPAGALPDILAYLMMFFVLYSNLVPVSLYASMELCNTAYSLFILHDKDMQNTIEVTTANGTKRIQEVKAAAHSTNLCHELGQVSYIFSDKTGTLTKNVMTLVEVAAFKHSRHSELVVYPRANFRSCNAEDLWEVLAVCHTGDWDPIGKKLEFESPDEEALVRGASEGGWNFWNKLGDTTEVRLQNECLKNTYKVLAVNDFTSARKRMSVVVEKDGQKWLFIKGADNVISGCCCDGLPTGIKHQVFLFSQKGLRTLIVGRRDLKNFDIAGWLKRYAAAKQATIDRESTLASLAEEIERDVSIDGCTAIEDELQDDVKETILMIRQAGIKLWVLTGDRLETAISIGFSTGVLQQHDMDIFALLNNQNREQEDQLHCVQFSTLPQILGLVQGSRQKNKALVITGEQMIEICNSDVLNQTFLVIAQKCDVVILARSSPLQKAQMLELVRDNVVVKGVIPRPVTLAIGDGANDVPMILASHVGIGIFGQEGRQAANSSDFAIGEFKFLRNLLFVHGRWNYIRTCKFILFTFWRNAVQVLLMFYYTTVSGYSGSMLFEDNIRISFNFLCTIPIIATGLFDRDTDAKESLEKPHLYEVGREGLHLTPAKMGNTLLSAFAHSCILMLLVVGSQPFLELSQSGDYWSVGCFTYTLLVHGIATRVVSITSSWNAWNVLSILTMYLAYMIFLVTYELVSSTIKPGFKDVIQHIFGTKIFWLSACALPLIQISCDLLLRNIDKIRSALSERSSEPTHNTLQMGPRYTWENALESFECWKGIGREVFCRRRCVVEPQKIMGDFLHQKFATYLVADTPGLSICINLMVLTILIAYSAYFSCPTASFVGLQYYTGNSDLDWKLPPTSSAFGDVHLDDCFADECTLTFPKNMKGPITLYYNIGPFYENSLDYIKPTDYVQNSFASSIAIRTVYNDTFYIEGVHMDQRDISWPTDLNFISYVDIDDNFSSLFESPEIAKEHAAVWMRPSAFPEVLKKYGTTNRSFYQGDRITIRVNQSYPGGDYHKRIWLTNWDGEVGTYWARVLAAASTLPFMSLCAIGYVSYLDKQKHAARTTTENSLQEPLRGMFTA